MTTVKPDSLDERIQSLSAGRRALLKRLQQQEQNKTSRAANPVREASIPRRDHDEPVPLSFAQRRLWFLHQLAPDSPFYDESTMLPLHTVLNPVELERSLNEIVERHEVLRTVFRTIDGEPAQIILPELHMPLLFRDLRLMPESEREDEALRFAGEELSKPFDLACGPLLRSALLQLGTEHYVLVLTMHHIVCDGWSMDVLFRELGEIYAAFITRRPSPLPPLPIQYADYALWQHKRLSGESLQRLLDYWKRQLKDLPTLNLSTDYPRPDVQSFRGAILRLELGVELTQRLKQLARAEGVTLFVLLLAAFKVLLYRHCRQDDIVVGAPVSGRSHSETQALIGFFVNSLVLRSDLSNNPPFREALQRVKRVVVDGFAHDELPFEILVEHLQPERSLDRNPLFQVAFQFVNSIDRANDGELAAASAAKSARGTAIFDQALTLWEGKEGIAGELEYCTELFAEETMQRIARRFELLLEAISVDSQQAIDELPLMSEDERQLLEAWNQTHIDTPPLTDIVTNVEKQAVKLPQESAVVFGDQQLSYGTLNRRANQLAHRLQQLDIGRESVVGVLMQRGPDCIVSILAILKSGAAYLPLDVIYPDERLNYILTDVGAALLLTRREGGMLLCHVPVPVLCVDDESEHLTDESEVNLSVRPGLGDLAYVIYTSGSTGQPKGVEVTHAGLANLIRWHRRTYGVDEHDHATHVASFAYDAAVWEIWPYLAAGATVHIADDITRLSAAALVDWMARDGITLTFLPTPLAEAVFDIRWPESLRLKALLTGGDALRRRPPSDLPCPVINHYGPTENSVVTTAATIEAGEASAGSPSIGRPIDNNRLYVLDRHGQLAPIGVPGELCIAGGGLARGYRGRPELTAQRFPPDPFITPPGGRMYASGDLVRWRNDGQIEFIGRIDHQVKIRGFRVELGEIEAELCRHPAVKEAVVVAREDTANDRRLAAYVVAQAGAEADDAVEQEQISHWQDLYNETYSAKASVTDPAFNIVGWNDSYTGAAIPAGEMADWVAETVAKIRRLQPRRVLEIGCGTGLLLLRLAPDCESYIGTDFSAAAIEFTGRQVHAGHLDECVQLSRCEATEVTGAVADGETFDTVILNSVVQYFPSVHYLVRVFERALATLAPGGRLFVGDVRHFGLLRAFHTDIELHHSADEPDPNALRSAIAKRLDQDSELALDPLFFLAFARRFPQVRSVEFQLKRSPGHNELNRFRYDVVLNCAEAPSAPATEEVPWQADLDLDRLGDLLSEKAPERLVLRQVPNTRIALAAVAARLVEEESAGGARELVEIAGQEAVGAIDPGLWPQWAAQRGYAVALSWNLDSRDGGYDVLLERSAESTDTPPALAFPFHGNLSLRDCADYGNQPLQALHQRHLAPSLRSHLLDRLPDYMLPSSITFLETLPLTANGKVDRRALPIPHSLRVEPGSGYVAPVNAVERALAAIWAETLTVERVGIHDNFFSHLGGHSLLATQLMARINDAFRAQLPLQWIFESPTVAEFAEVMTGNPALAERLERTAELLLSLDHLVAAEEQEAELS